MEESIRKLGPYQLIREIGSGAFGTVWLAEKPTPLATMQVALKLPHNKAIDLEALKREAAIWIKANGHPNVLRMIDADIYDNQVVIVSEYAPDGSLLRWLKQYGDRAPSIEAASEMIDGVLAGLAHLHERHIIHRDLKPDNILLQNSAPLLADFGISRLLPSSSYSLTIGGTPVYMAPEAFNYKRNEQTDIWSVGIIFYQLLTGALPYNHPDIDSLRNAITNYDPPPMPKSVSEGLRHIVEKALQRNPVNRYKSATDMRQDLREAGLMLRLENRGTIMMPRAEPLASTLGPTLPAPEDSKRPVLSATKPVISANVLRGASLRPTRGQRYVNAFWIFLSLEPSLSFRDKLKISGVRALKVSIYVASFSAMTPIIESLSGNFRGAVLTRSAVEALLGCLAIAALFISLFVMSGYGQWGKTQTFGAGTSLSRKLVRALD